MNDQPDSAVVEMLVALACRAPSVHNSQPWRWTYPEYGLDLYTDSSRLLGVIDPTERQMVMSCGAALDHLHKAAAAFRWTTEIDLLPTPGAPDRGYQAPGGVLGSAERRCAGLDSSRHAHDRPAATPNPTTRCGVRAVRSRTCNEQETAMTTHEQWADVESSVLTVG